MQSRVVPLKVGPQSNGQTGRNNARDRTQGPISEPEEENEVETLKARVLQMRGAHMGSAQSPTRLHARERDGAMPMSLDVGGTVYTASRAVLRSVPDSWLARVANGSVSLPRTASDIRFIDRDAQAFRYVLAYLRGLTSVDSSSAGLSSQHGKGNSTSRQPSLLLPTSRDDLAILSQECQFYELPELEAETAKALKAAPAVSTSITPSGTVTATSVAGVVDDTTDIYSKASRMQLEFQSVYVTISSSNGLLFTEEERRTAMEEVNARTAELQGSGFRVKAMNTGVAQDRKTKDYCMYFHAVLVRNTGKRVPTANGEPVSQLPPKASQTHGSSITSTTQSSHQLPGSRQTPPASRPSPQHGANTSGSKRNSVSALPGDHSAHSARSADSSSLLNERQMAGNHVHPHSHQYNPRSSTEGVERFHPRSSVEPGERGYGAGRTGGEGGSYGHGQAGQQRSFMEGGSYGQSGHRASVEGSVIPSPSAGGSGGGHTSGKSSRSDRAGERGASATPTGLPRGAPGSRAWPPNGHASDRDSVASPQPAQALQMRSPSAQPQRSASASMALERQHTGGSIQNGVAKEAADANLHASTGATSAHAKSSNSQQVNTSSTIDSMLAAGQQAAQPPQKSPPAATTADVEKAHAAALANLGLPYVLDGGPRRHSEVRVFDINTDGPPKGIPREWEEGLLEGRKRPGESPGQPVRHSEHVPARDRTRGEPLPRGASVDHSTDDVRMAAQNAAEASVEQAKRRAAAKAKLAMTGPRTQPVPSGPPMHAVERGPQSVRYRDLDRPAVHDILRSKSDLHLYVRDANEVASKPRPKDLSASVEAAVADPRGDGTRSSRHRFRLTNFGRVFGSKKDPKRSASVNTVSRSATSPLTPPQYRPV